jgi:ribonuclease HI
VRVVAGAGIVVRNNEGAFIAAACRRYNHIEDLLSIVLMACRDAMVFAIQQNYTKVMIETDCQAVVEMWRRRKDNVLSGVHLIREMQIYEESFQECELIFVRRSSNKAAHQCAEEALVIESLVVDFVAIPGF